MADTENIPPPMDGPGKAAKQPPSGLEVASGFSSLLLTPEFFEKHWERWPLHHRAADAGGANRLPEAIVAGDIADVIRRAGPSLKMFRQGDPYDEQNFYVAYLDGATLIVNQAERCNQTLYDFCRVLSASHFHHVFGVVYLTPPDSQGVRLHNDDQDVFLMQVWGKKHWTLRNAPKLLPYTEEMLGKDAPVPDELVMEEIMNFTMEPGDVLYIPRGFLHEAKTSAEPSLHITVTVPTSDYCWGIQLIKHFMSEVLAGDNPELRKISELKLGLGGVDESTLDAKLEEAMKKWASGVTVDGVIDAFENRMIKVNNGQERSHGQAMSMPLRPAITEECRVRLMQGITCSCALDSELAVFKREAQRLELPISRTASALIRSLSSKPQKVADLPCADTFERLCVLNLLHQQSIIQMFLRGPDERTMP